METEATAAVSALRIVITNTPLPTTTPAIETDIEAATPVKTSTPLLRPSPSTPLSATPTSRPAFPPFEGPPLQRERIGIQVHIHHEDIEEIVEHLETLGVGWVKVQVSWKLYQPDRDRYDMERFAELDELIRTAREREIDVLLGVSKAPEWSRSTTEQDGPPLDYSLYADFMSFLADRYRGQVDAYELWNEPNLQREWNGAVLSAADFAQLVEIGAEGARAADPEILIISGAPAVTGINDGIVAIDDRVYLRGMLEAGIETVVDAIGVHPYGWANPPGSSFEKPASFVTSHHDHPSFFFQDTLADYSNLLDENGVSKQLWATEFGWGSFDGILNKQGTPEPAPDHASFMNQVSEFQQATYNLQALQTAQTMDVIGPLFLWNLNFGPLLGTQFSESGYSLLGTDGSPRPAYLSLQHAAKK
ncbi:MAG: cellulase family glycosylhydrolase [Candidatus Promineifilaceae bacterium]|nr:cellulase family glycosylhydrolase [Candidatus Promineifilaceae bacterium]